MLGVDLIVGKAFMAGITALHDLDYHHTLMAVDGVALVYFTAPDCGSCRSLKLALQQYADTVPDVSIFEVDAVHNGGLVNEFEIFHLPTLFMYLDGAFHADLQCMALPDAIRVAVSTAAVLPAEDEP